MPNNDFQTLNKWQQKAVIPERRDRNYLSSMVAPAYFLERVSKPQHRERESKENPEFSLN